MNRVSLPVQFRDDHLIKHQTLQLGIEKTAFVLIDCTFENRPESGVGRVLRQTIAPTLAAVRSVGMPVVFIHGGEHGDPRSMFTEVHRSRHGKPHTPRAWQPEVPVWVPGVEPTAEDVIIEKNGQSGFRGTHLDHCLRSMGIETLICVGFSFKSCLFYTMVGAFEHNYRVVFLRDGTHPLGENEFEDTLDERLPEKGWVRVVLTRLIEDHLGYSSTCDELRAACK